MKMLAFQNTVWETKQLVLAKFMILICKFLIVLEESNLGSKNPKTLLCFLCYSESCDQPYSAGILSTHLGTVKFVLSRPLFRILRLIVLMVTSALLTAR